MAVQPLGPNVIRCGISLPQFLIIRLTFGIPFRNFHGPPASLITHEIPDPPATSHGKQPPFPPRDLSLKNIIH
jgi:hypothetical protein